MKQVKLEDDFLIAQLREIEIRSTCNEQAFDIEFPEGTPSDDKIKYWFNVLKDACEINYIKYRILNSVKESIGSDKIYNISSDGVVCYE